MEISDKLLNVNRIQSNQVKVKPEPAKLIDAIALPLNAIKDSTHKHEFMTNISPEIEVLVDKDKFKSGYLQLTR